MGLGSTIPTAGARSAGLTTVIDRAARMAGTARFGVRLDATSTPVLAVSATDHAGRLLR